MKTALLIFVGGGFGSLARFAVGRFGSLAFGSNFPYGTLVANVLASLLLGYVTARFMTVESCWKPLLAIGFCGGFSTFSTFSSDTLRLFTEGRTAEAFSNIALNVIICLAAIYVGVLISEQLS